MKQIVLNTSVALLMACLFTPPAEAQQFEFHYYTRQGRQIPQAERAQLTHLLESEFSFFADRDGLANRFSIESSNTRVRFNISPHPIDTTDSHFQLYSVSMRVSPFDQTASTLRRFDIRVFDLEPWQREHYENLFNEIVDPGSGRSMSIEGVGGSSHHSYPMPIHHQAIIFEGINQDGSEGFRALEILSHHRAGNNAQTLRIMPHLLIRANGFEPMELWQALLTDYLDHLFSRPLHFSHVPFDPEATLAEWQRGNNGAVSPILRSVQHYGLRRFEQTTEVQWSMTIAALDAVVTAIREFSEPEDLRFEVSNVFRSLLKEGHHKPLVYLWMVLKAMPFITDDYYIPLSLQEVLHQQSLFDDPRTNEPLSNAHLLADEIEFAFRTNTRLTLGNISFAELAEVVLLDQELKRDTFNTIYHSDATTIAQRLVFAAAHDAVVTYAASMFLKERVPSEANMMLAEPLLRRLPRQIIWSNQYLYPLFDLDAPAVPGPFIELADYEDAEGMITFYFPFGTQGARSPAESLAEQTSTIWHGVAVPYLNMPWGPRWIRIMRIPYEELEEASRSQTLMAGPDGVAIVAIDISQTPGAILLGDVPVELFEGVVEEVVNEEDFPKSAQEAIAKATEGENQTTLQLRLRDAWLRNHYQRLAGRSEEGDLEAHRTASDEQLAALAHVANVISQMLSLYRFRDSGYANTALRNSSVLGSRLEEAPDDTTQRTVNAEIVAIAENGPLFELCSLFARALLLPEMRGIGLEYILRHSIMPTSLAVRILGSLEALEDTFLNESMLPLDQPRGNAPTDAIYLQALRDSLAAATDLYDTAIQGFTAPKRGPELLSWLSQAYTPTKQPTTAAVFMLKDTALRALVTIESLFEAASSRRLERRIVEQTATYHLPSISYRRAFASIVDLANSGGAATQRRAAERVRDAILSKDVSAVFTANGDSVAILNTLLSLRVYFLSYQEEVQLTLVNSGPEDISKQLMAIRQYLRALSSNQTMPNQIRTEASHNLELLETHFDSLPRFTHEHADSLRALHAYLVSGPGKSHPYAQRTAARLETLLALLVNQTGYLEQLGTEPELDRRVAVTLAEDSEAAIRGEMAPVRRPVAWQEDNRLPVLSKVDLALASAQGLTVFREAQQLRTDVGIILRSQSRR